MAAIRHPYTILSVTHSCSPQIPQPRVPEHSLESLTETYSDLYDCAESTPSPYEHDAESRLQVCAPSAAKRSSSKRAVHTGGSLSAQEHDLQKRSTRTPRCCGQRNECIHAYGEVVWSSGAGFFVQFFGVVSPPTIMVYPKSTYAAWIPAGLPHRILSDDPDTLRAFRHTASMPAPIMPLLLLFDERPRLASLPRSTAEHSVQRAFLASGAVCMPRTLPPMPHNDALMAIAHRILREPDAEHAVAHIESGSYMSYSTLRRLLHSETGMTYSEWRSRLRLHVAVRLVACGETITAAAKATGFSYSGIHHAAQRAFGMSPAAFVRAMSC